MTYWQWPWSSHWLPTKERHKIKKVMLTFEVRLATGVLTAEPNGRIGFDMLDQIVKAHSELLLQQSGVIAVTFKDWKLIPLRSTHDVEANGNEEQPRTLTTQHQE